MNKLLSLGIIIIIIGQCYIYSLVLGLKSVAEDASYYASQAASYASDASDNASEAASKASDAADYASNCPGN